LKHVSDINWMFFGCDENLKIPEMFKK